MGVGVAVGVTVGVAVAVDVGELVGVLVGGGSAQTPLLQTPLLHWAPLPQGVPSLQSAVWPQQLPLMLSHSPVVHWVPLGLQGVPSLQLELPQHR